MMRLEKAVVAQDVLAEPQEGALAVAWRLARPTAVPADGTPHRTTVATATLDARLDHVVAPAVDPAAHLRATVVNTGGPRAAGRSALGVPRRGLRRHHPRRHDRARRRAGALPGCRRPGRGRARADGAHPAPRAARRQDQRGRAVADRGPQRPSRAGAARRAGAGAGVAPPGRPGRRRRRQARARASATSSAASNGPRPSSRTAPGRRTCASGCDTLGVFRSSAGGEDRQDGRVIAPLPDAAAARSLARLRPAVAEDAHRLLEHGDAVGFLARLDLWFADVHVPDQQPLRRTVRRPRRAARAGSRWPRRWPAPPTCATSTGAARSTRGGTSTSGWSATSPTPTASRARWRSCPARLDHLAELGVTYLHLMPLLKPREGANDGGYAVADYRAVDPRVGTMDDLAQAGRRAARPRHEPVRRPGAQPHRARAPVGPRLARRATPSTPTSTTPTPTARCPTPTRRRSTTSSPTRPPAPSRGWTKRRRGCGPRSSRTSGTSTGTTRGCSPPCWRRSSGSPTAASRSSGWTPCRSWASGWARRA